MRLNKLNDNVYYSDFISEGDRPVLGLIVGEEASLIVDGGNSKAHIESFIEEAKKVVTSPIKYMVITHWHWDHVFGIHWAKELLGITPICNDLTNKKISYLKTLKWTEEDISKRVETGEEIEFCKEHMLIELPDLKNIEIDTCSITFKEKIEIDLGSVKCNISQIISDHSEDCSIVEVKGKEKVVFLGDCLYLDMYNGPWSFTREKLYPMLESLLYLDAKWYIPSHHGMYSKNGFEGYAKYLIGIGEIVGNLTDEYEAYEAYEKYKLRSITDNEKEDINSFIKGNVKKGR